MGTKPTLDVRTLSTHDSYDSSGLRLTIERVLSVKLFDNSFAFLLIRFVDGAEGLARVRIADEEEDQEMPGTPAWLTCTDDITTIGDKNVNVSPLVIDKLRMVTSASVKTAKVDNANDNCASRLLVDGRRQLAAVFTADLRRVTIFDVANDESTEEDVNEGGEVVMDGHECCD